jgi:putative hydrolase of the HAD superfamily
MTDAASRNRVVVFDLGGVLVDPLTLNDDLAAVLNADAETFRAAYWVRRLEYDLGLPVEDYWDDVFARLEVSPTPEERSTLIRVDSEGWTTLRPEAHDILERLHREDVRIAIMSNATKEMGEAARASSWARWVSDWFFSAELGLAKPNEELYKHVSASLHVAPRDLHYLEDVQRGVDVAQDLGWTAHLWTSQSRGEEWLRARDLLRDGIGR